MTQFSDLPEEVQIEVFKLLDAQSLKNAALVCSTWNRVISKSMAIMRKLILTVKTVWSPTEGEEERLFNEKLEQLMMCKRQFSSIRIHVPFKFNQKLFSDVVEHYGRQLISFKLHSYCLQDGMLLIELFKTMPKLKNLTISSNHFMHLHGPIADNSIRPVTLKKLKKLVVEKDERVFHLIKAPTLLELQADNPGSSVSFGSFLKSCSGLESLHLTNFRPNTMNLDSLFRLKKFTVCGWNEKNLSENSKNFLLSQAASVEVLKATCYAPEFHEIVLSKFKRLKVLDLNFSLLVASPEFWQSLKPLPILTDLKCDGFSCNSIAETILQNCPSLLNLECDNYESNNFLNVVADSSKILKSLTTLTIRGNGARFQCLKYLTVAKVENPDQFIDFLKANPTVETLNIKKLPRRRFGKDFRNALVKETSLKHLRIHCCGRTALKEVYETIKIGFGTWKTLELSCHKGGTDWKCRFEFPENPADWKPYRNLFHNKWTDENGLQWILQQ